jgi:hypothetical protein
MLARAARSVRGGYRHHCYCRGVWIIAMKLRWILAVLMAAMSLFAVGSAASASTVFKVSNGPWTTYFGTLTIDTVNGLVVGGDVWVIEFSGQTTEYSIIDSVFDGPTIQVGFRYGNDAIFGLLVLDIFPGPLVGFTGGQVIAGSAGGCSHIDGNTSCLYPFISFADPIGTVEATPLPAALPLFATGLGALGLLGWRRKKKTVALAA